MLPQANRPQRPLDHVPGIENFGFVSADVWRGARPTAQGYQTLREMGVGTVIDLELPGQMPACPPELSVRNLPVAGWHADRVDTAKLNAILWKDAMGNAPIPASLKEHRKKSDKDDD